MERCPIHDKALGFHFQPGHTPSDEQVLCSATWRREMWRNGMRTRSLDPKQLRRYLCDGHGTNIVNKSEPRLSHPSSGPWWSECRLWVSTSLMSVGSWGLGPQEGADGWGPQGRLRGVTSERFFPPASPHLSFPSNTTLWPIVAELRQ